MRRAFIVRHGNTFAPGEAPRRIGARTDLPLVESGRAQALALREHFARASIAFDRVLTSPLERTRETAVLIAPDRLAEPTDWLREIDHGPDEDRSEEDVIARIGREALNIWEQSAEPPPDWVVDAPARLAAWRDWLATPEGETTLIVTSNGAARFALLALDLPPAKLRTGAYSEIAWDDANARLVDWDIRPR